MKNKQLQVGDLVKDKWSAIHKIADWKKQSYGITVDYHIPPMGIIKKIKKVSSFYNKIINDKKEKIKYDVDLAEVEWMIAKIPEINGETSKWELKHYLTYRTEVDIKQLSSYNTYYKNLLRRLHEKNP